MFSFLKLTPNETSLVLTRELKLIYKRKQFATKFIKWHLLKLKLITKQLSKLTEYVSIKELWNYKASPSLVEKFINVSNINID